MKYIFLVLLFFLSGCAPHFYTAESVVLTEQDLTIAETQYLSEECISETNIPKTYFITRENYSLHLEVKARQIGFRIIADSSNISVFADSMKLNNPNVTRLSAEYLNYLPIYNEGLIKFVVSDGKQIIANELIDTKVVTCKAVAVDGV